MGIKVGAIILVIVLAILFLAKCGGEIISVHNECPNLPMGSLKTAGGTFSVAFDQVGTSCSDVGSPIGTMWDGLQPDLHDVQMKCSTGSVVEMPANAEDGCNVDADFYTCTIAFAQGLDDVHMHFQWSQLKTGKAQALGTVEVTTPDGTCANFYEVVITQ